jgi:hypothetical protein
MNKYIKPSSLFLALIILGFSSCKKDDETTVTNENYKGLLVVNEGGFSKSNGSIGLYKPGNKTYFDAFMKANNRPLGDVVQSIQEIDGKYYVVVNNSNKIEVINPDGFQNVGTISTGSPRYVLKVGTDKAYVTNLYNNSIQILKISSNSISASININHGSDQIAKMDSLVYISTFDNKVMVVNANTNMLVDSIVTASGLSKIVNVGSGRLAILCTGNVDFNTGNVLENGKILLVNNDSVGIEKSIDLSSGSYGGSMVYCTADRDLYFSLGNSIINKSSLSGVITEFKNLGSGKAVYGLTYNAKQSEIYVMDAGDFNSDGTVTAFNLNADQVLEFKAGIAPNSVLINE